MSKHQILIIGGGETFDDYQTYFDFIKYDFKFDTTKRKANWKDTLNEKLGKSFDVLTIKMPSPLNAKYIVREVYFRKVLRLIRKDSAIVAHSLGALFILKFLSENEYAIKKIKGLFLISTPYNILHDRGYADFILDPALFKEHDMQFSHIEFIHAEDDGIVNASHMWMYALLLPNAKQTFTKEGGHFISQKSLPILTRRIKKLYGNK